MDRGNAQWFCVVEESKRALRRATLLCSLLAVVVGCASEDGGPLTAAECEQGVCVHGEGGWLNLPAARAYDPNGKLLKSFSGGEDHFENFIRAVRSGRRDMLRAEDSVNTILSACSARTISAPAS